MSQTFALPLAQGPVPGSSAARRPGTAAGGVHARPLAGASPGKRPAGAPGDNGGSPSFQAALAAHRPNGGPGAGKQEVGRVPPGDEGGTEDLTPDPSAAVASVAVAGLLTAGQVMDGPAVAGEGEVAQVDAMIPAGDHGVPVEGAVVQPGFPGPAHLAGGAGAAAVAALAVAGDGLGEDLPGAAGLSMEPELSPVTTQHGPAPAADDGVASALPAAATDEAAAQPAQTATATPEQAGQGSHQPLAADPSALGQTPGKASKVLPGGDATAPAADPGDAAALNVPPATTLAVPPEAGPGLDPVGPGGATETPLVDHGPAAGELPGSAADGFRLHQAGDGRGMRVAFAPDGLGAIEIAVREERLGLGLRMHAAQAATARLLAANLDDLVAALRQREPGAISVSVRHSGDDGAAGSGAGPWGDAMPGDGRGTGSFHREFRSQPREHSWPRNAGTPAAATAAAGRERAGSPRPGWSMGGRLNRWV